MIVLIVDDEMTARSGLEQLDMWKRLGVTKVLTAPNGQAAIECMQTAVPTILITDVRMPKMDGIELSGYVQKKYPDCGIIFLSGYSDKEYLVHAIHVKAFCYLEKPVDFVQLEEACHDIIGRVCQKQQKKAEEIRQQMQIESMRPFLRQQLLYQLIYGDNGMGIFYKEETKKLFLPHLQEAYQIVAVQLHWNPEVPEQKIGRVRNEFLIEMNQKKYENMLVGFVVPTLFLALIQDTNDAPDSGTGRLSEQLELCLAGRIRENASYQIAKSAKQKLWNKIPQTYRETLELLNYRFYLQKGEHLLEHKVVHCSYELPSNFYQEYRNLLQSGSAEELCRIVGRLTEEISETRDGDVLKIKNIYFNLLRILFEHTMHWSDSELADTSDDSAYIWKAVNDRVSLIEMADFLIENIRTLIGQGSEAGHKSRIESARKYIEENYKDSQLSIASIAEHAQVCETYLCALFKKEMNTTVNQYIQKLRVAEACRLLENPEVRMYEIAAKVGYSDTNYFSTLFKRIRGMTPSAWREGKMRR